MNEQLKEKIMEALEEVVDPELGIDIVNLGLIYEINIDGDYAKVKMTMTSMGCPMAGTIMAGVKMTIIENVEGINHVDVDIVWNPPWTKEKMSRYAKLALGIHS